MSSTQPARMQSTNPNPAGEDLVRCFCDEPATRYTSNTALNPGRQFYTCGKDRSDPSKCKFWCKRLQTMTANLVMTIYPIDWADNPMFREEAAPPPPEFRSTPGASQRQRAENARAPSTLQKSPNKRLLSPLPLHNGAPETPSEKRKRLIQAALDTDPQRGPSGQGSSSAQRHSSTYHDEGNSSSPTRASGQRHAATQSSTSDVNLGELLLPSPPHDSPSAISEHLSHAPSPPSTPQRPGREYTGGRADAEGSTSMLLTPPKTTHGRNGNTSRQSESGGLFDTPTKPKGKERSNTQWENIMQDEDHPFHQVASSLQLASPPRENQTIPRAFDPFAGPVAGETPAEAIAGHLEALDTAKAAQYILKLERKFTAAQKSNEAKAKKIEELLAENAELKKQLHSSEENSRVKDTIIGSLKARRPL
ncbi:hypothetical protein BV22DRAFT_98622 [Leucogyrophana mollusca]|uniref:Uncharacterized protein n=1 Tax=Leucogyrophana mollusca TaxID=85980 RepID=A0ACB8BV66_9AGAM|nr:hypothetical protein BV22DRAFT_98622 [Leucogyrophana mollusca]